MARGTLLALLLLISTPAATVEIPAEIEACMKQNLPASTSVQALSLIHI